MTNNDLVYGFLDESPNLQDKFAFFSVVIILSTNPDEKSYRSIFKKTRKNVLKKKQKEIPELKFANSTPQVRIKILKAIGKRSIKISAYILDKAGRRIPDTPENYGIVAGFAISEVLKKYPVIVLTFDKKYTKVKDQEEVERVTLKVVAKVLKKGVLQFKEHGDSKANSILQMADFVAGAVSYKYNLNDKSYWELIKDLIEQENKESWIDIKAIYKQ
ncbi:MAG: DUF3800 domain-containing protein [Candidatus Daviesbacteria bacterium]|nr:DUF3800 domain-containing protein [Candidatus Daviesbacteria bacterium]